MLEKLFGRKKKEQALREETIHRLKDMERSQIRITYTLRDGELSLGASKLGGMPDLPRGFEFPYFEGEGMDDTVKNRPLAFLAQINLKEAAQFDREHLLPESGLLSFFDELDSQRWGFDPKDKGCARVYYFPEGTHLVRTPLPAELAEESLVPELAVQLRQEPSFPSWEDFTQQPIWQEPGEVKESWRKWAMEDDHFEELQEALGIEEDDEIIKLLGWPNVIQNAMGEECEIVSRGYYTGDQEGYEKIPEQEKPGIAQRAGDWRLLLQMDTVETDDYELMFGDCGRLYFWIRAQDLKERKFDDIWLISQCY